MRLKAEIAAPRVRAVAPVLLGAVMTAALPGLTGCSGPTGHDAAAPRAGDRAAVSAPPGPEATVDLKQWITAFTDRIAQGGHYRIPAAGDREALATGVRRLVDGDPAGAERSLARAGYHARTVVDRDGGRKYAEVADATQDGEATRGWGRVYVDLGAPVRWQVQVPHPAADQRSEQLGIGVLRGAPGGVLILAGAYRSGGPAGDEDAPDVAHRTDSVFAAVAGALADARLPAVQVHGFADSSLPDEDVVVSPGKGDAGLPAARRLSAALRREELRVCEVWKRYCGRLEGRTNVEGDHADAVGVPFLHVEHARRVRMDDALVARAVRALTRVVERWGAGRAG
ncbi:hypothetical protein GCM10010218_02170 [Streptomyces mashuensis]|uniref:Uncharacterized protein n=1 Tax=Streptomyces mashuensis TaxID=33904 RepID=A0A919E8Q2_9ACTN|nr:hypothetical protein [Streptomyces mashuensis]GHF25062.1 hypothetical protein GCM10010218_02170 [Streptomyces mashuensis]